MLRRGWNRVCTVHGGVLLLMSPMSLGDAVTHPWQEPCVSHLNSCRATVGDILSYSGHGSSCICYSPSNTCGESVLAN